MRRCCVLLAALVCCAPAAAQDEYLCVQEQSTGFAFESGQWASARFRANGTYVVRRANEDERAAFGKWLVTKVGESSPFTWCADDFNEFGGLRCDGGGLYTWWMAKDSLRFLGAYLVGYVNGRDNNDDTPHMFIGKCSPL